MTLSHPARARREYWSVLIVLLWALTGGGLALWCVKGRGWWILGLTFPEGWRLWGAAALAVALVAVQVRTARQVARSAAARTKVRAQFGGLSVMLPHARAELVGFAALSLTAGFCEEFIFRGYLIWFFQTWLGWWGAAALSAIGFAFAHAYQGSSGIVRAGIVGVVLTVVMAMFRSLWPCIILHALIDLGSGIIAWIALREEPDPDDRGVGAGEPAR